MTSVIAMDVTVVFNPIFWILFFILDSKFCFYPSFYIFILPWDNHTSDGVLYTEKHPIEFNYPPMTQNHIPHNYSSNIIIIFNPSYNPL